VSAPIPGRGTNGKFTRTVESAKRDAEAARLRSLGLSFRQIAEQLKFSDASCAHRAYRRGLAAVPVEAGQELRATSLARLDIATQKVFEVLLRRHMLAQNGRVAVDPATRQPLVDDGPLLAAVDRLVKLEERRSKLLGLDSPAKVDMTVSDEMDRRIAALMAEMGNPIVENRPALEDGLQPEPVNHP
jgi:hypothetical protein